MLTLVLRLDIFLKFWISEKTENEERGGDRQFDGRKMGYGEEMKVLNMFKKCKADLFTWADK